MVDGGSSPADGRGTPPPADRRGTPPPGDGRGTPPGGDPQRGSPFGASNDGHPSAAEREGPPTDGEGNLSEPKDPQIWGVKWDFYKRLSIGPILEKVKSAWGSSSTTELADPEDLLGLSLYYSIVHGPPMTKEEEAQVLRQVEYVLKQVQMHVRALDQEPTELDAMKIDQKISIRTVPNSNFPRSLADVYSGLLKHSEDRSPSLFKSAASQPKADALLTEQEEKIRELEEAVRDIKALISVGVQSNHCSVDFAQKLKARIDCMDSNVKIIMNRRSFCFTLPGLVSKLHKPQFVSNFFEKVTLYTFAIQKGLTVADCVLENVGTSPTHFTSFGKEAQKLLNDDFSFKKLKLNAGALKTGAIAVGAQGFSGENIKLIMMKLKGHNQCISFSFRSFDGGAGVNVANAANANENENANANANANAAVENEVCSTKLTLHNLYWDGLKGSIKLPYPVTNAKIELVLKRPYYAFSGDVGLHRANAADAVLPYYPKINMSAVFGFKSAGLGYQFSFDTEQEQVLHSVGINIRKDLLAVGLTLNQGGIYKAYACKKIIDTPTTIALQASYSPEAGEEQGAKICVGVKHALDPDLYIKARAGSAGIGVAVKKTWLVGKADHVEKLNDDKKSSWFSGKAAAHLEKLDDGKKSTWFSGNYEVKAAAHIENLNEWRQPKLGVVFSFRR